MMVQAIFDNLGMIAFATMLMSVLLIISQVLR